MVISIFDDNAGGARVRFWGVKHLRRIIPKSRDNTKYVLAGTFLAQSTPTDNPRFAMVYVR